MLQRDPRDALYGPVKSFIITFSEGLSAQLQSTGVCVTAVCPGYTRTNLHERAGAADEAQRIPSYMWSDADAVVRSAFRAAMRGRVIFVPGRLNRLIAHFCKVFREHFAATPTEYRRQYLADSEPRTMRA